MTMQNIGGIMRDLNAEQATYLRRSVAIKMASLSVRRNAIDRACGRYVIESDKFFTREQKAIRILEGK